MRKRIIIVLALCLSICVMEVNKFDFVDLLKSDTVLKSEIPDNEQRDIVRKALGVEEQNEDTGEKNWEELSRLIRDKKNGEWLQVATEVGLIGKPQTNQLTSTDKRIRV